MIYPTVEDYNEALKISVSLLRSGNPLPAVDILIASICIRRDLVLYTADEHFKRIRSVSKKLRIEMTKP